MAGLESTRDWAFYEQQAKPFHPDLSTVAYIHHNVREGDLVWTHDETSRFYLARVLSGWEYWTNAESTEHDIDLANVFRCELRQVELALVPGHVKAAFRASATIRRIPGEQAMVYAQFLWNRLVGANVYQLPRGHTPDVFALLDSEELEDVVFIYLQRRGWCIIPNSRKRDTMRFEYIAVHPETSEVALTQVKSGQTPLNRTDYRGMSERVFLFQAHGHYQGEESPQIICIRPEEIRAFLTQSYRWLPASLRLRIDMAAELAGVA